MKKFIVVQLLMIIVLTTATSAVASNFIDSGVLAEGVTYEYISNIPIRAALMDSFDPEAVPSMTGLGITDPDGWLNFQSERADFYNFTDRRVVLATFYDDYDLDYAMIRCNLHIDSVLEGDDSIAGQDIELIISPAFEYERESLYNLRLAHENPYINGTLIPELKERGIHLYMSGFSVPKPGKQYIIYIIGREVAGEYIYTTTADMSQITVDEPNFIQLDYDERMYAMLSDVIKYDGVILKEYPEEFGLDYGVNTFDEYYNELRRLILEYYGIKAE